MRERESRKMELVNVRDLFRRQDEYVDQTIAIGGWVRNCLLYTSDAADE